MFLSKLGYSELVLRLFENPLVLGLDVVETRRWDDYFTSYEREAATPLVL